MKVDRLAAKLSVAQERDFQKTESADAARRLILN
jgi:hypothetical protein